MELDIFLPEINLAFEYQGKHHSMDTLHFGPNALQEMKDKEKLIACEREGIILIRIPHWWDMTRGSIKKTIGENHPQLLHLIS
jgi:hypothetical protein